MKFKLYQISLILISILILLFTLVNCDNSTKPVDQEEPDSDQYTSLSGPYLGQEIPGNTAVKFVPGELESTSTWWWHGSSVFTPDGQEFYLDINDGIRDKMQIDYMKQNNGIWTKRVPASFTNVDYDNSSPSFSNNGNRVFFTSNMPSEFPGRI